MAESFCLIRLPFPRQIIPLRFAKAQTSPETTRLSKVLHRDSPQFSSCGTELLITAISGWNLLRHGSHKSGHHRSSIFTFLRNQSLWYLRTHAMRAFDEMIQLFSGIDLKLTRFLGLLFSSRHESTSRDRSTAPNRASRNAMAHCEIGIKGVPRSANCFMIMVDARKAA